MKTTNQTRRTVMLISHSLTTNANYTQSAALKKAWAIVKSGSVISKVSGVTIGNRQRAIEHLTQYSRDIISVDLVRDSLNEYDNNAVEVIITVSGRGSYSMGYLPRNIAYIAAKLIDRGIVVPATFEGITGKYETYMNYGLSIGLRVA